MEVEKSRAKILGENLERIRKEKGLSRKQLAAAIGVKETSYGAYERGTNLAPLDKIFELADFLDVSIVDLTGENPNVEERKIFAQRFRHAFNLAVIANYSPIQLDDGGVLLDIPDKKKFSSDNSPLFVSWWSTEIKIDSVEDFVKTMELAERQSIQKEITFDAAFRELLKKN